MLSLLAKLYGKIISIRNWLYDRGIFEVYDLRARTISVGNLTTGGTGKTPLVIYIAKLLAERGETVCILTRGYGRSDSKTRVLVSDLTGLQAIPDAAGDEPFEIASKLLGKAIVVADADRVAAAEWARRKFGVTAFVLDDGFQHRKAKRDVDIVCTDATNPFGGDGLLPAGHLRESINGLKRADAIVVTRANLVDDISNLRSEISDLVGSTPIFECRTEITDISAIGSTNKFDSSDKVFAFSGLGNPDAFVSQLKANQFNVAGNKNFADHHNYTQIDIDSLEKQAKVFAAEAFLTTAKDAVKLANLKFETPCFVVEVGVVIDDPGSFEALL